MNTLSKIFMATMATTVILSGCGSSSTEVPPPAQIPTTGTVSVLLTDGPWEDAMEMVLHVTGIEMGHSDGRVIDVELAGGPMSIDMMQLQNGVAQMLADNIEAPVGQYDWMRLTIDPNLSHIDLASTGGRHNMQMGSGASQGLEINEPFEIGQSLHSEFMLDFDIRRGVQHHEGGMMVDEYQLHSAMRMVDMSESGSLVGAVHSTLIDVNHPDCDDAPGGNWAYLYHGEVMEPDDIAEPDSDGMDGPIAADRIELDVATGEHRYHFAYLSPGNYRVATTCASEWDEVGDDDYPSDPDARFSFQMFSDPIEVMSGQTRDHDMGP
jgi:uncharacterized protein DUF4382